MTFHLIVLDPTDPFLGHALAQARLENISLHATRKEADEALDALLVKKDNEHMYERNQYSIEEFIVEAIAIKNQQPQNFKQRLVYDLYGANLAGEVRHPQLVLKELGITYQLAIPQSMMSNWWFFNCENVPDKLPSFIEENPVKDLSKLIGYGLSQEMVGRLESYAKQRTQAGELIIPTARLEQFIANVRKAREEGIYEDSSKWEPIDGFLNDYGGLRG